MTEQQARILESIPIGHRNVIPASELCGLLGVNERYLRSIINELRLMREPIVSNNYGYFIADIRDPIDVRELKKFLKVLGAHVRTEQKIVAAVSEWLQMPLEI